MPQITITVTDDQAARIQAWMSKEHPGQTPQEVLLNLVRVRVLDRERIDATEAWEATRPSTVEF